MHASDAARPSNTPSKISVAMATCEGAAYVEAQLESLRRQTRLPDQLVVCDDASSDDTCAIVEAFARTAPFGVELFRNPERTGTTRNFEQALGRTHGDIVFFADQDDVWQPEKIAVLASTLEADPGLGAAFCNGRVVDADGQPLGYDLWTALGFDAGERGRVRNGRAWQVFLRHVVAAGTTLAFRGHARERAIPFPELRSAHDAWVAFLAACLEEIAIVESPLIDYRLHGGNQLGLRRHGLRSQLEQARRQLDLGAFDYAARFFDAAARRLQALRERSGLEARPECLAGIEAKIAHARARDTMTGNLPRRLPAILRELASGRYSAYSYGMKSVLQDLVLR